MTTQFKLSIFTLEIKQEVTTMNEALKQVSDSLAKLLAQQINRKLEAEKMIKENNVEGIADLILCQEKMEQYKKDAHDTHKYCMKLKQFLAQKGLTGEFCDWLEGK